MNEAKITKRTVISMFFPDKEVTTLECVVDAPFEHQKIDEVKITYSDGTVRVHKLGLKI